MEELKNLVRALEKEWDTERQFKLLQEINRLLLTDFAAEAGDFIIEPLLVEAYYFAEGKFEDTDTHGFKSEKSRRGQAGRFGKLYVHKIGYGGIDLCLSLSDDYCLSFLIKNSLLLKKENPQEKIFCAQVSLSRILKENLGSAEKVEETGRLIRRKSDRARVIDTVRKGVKGSFKDRKLACVSVEGLKNYPLTLEKGHGKESLVKEYLEKEYAFSDPLKWEQVSRDILGYSLKGFIEDHFGNP